MTTNSSFDLKLPAGLEGETPQPFPCPVFEPEDYKPDLVGLKLTEEQEKEFLETLWAIMGAFARMGFDADVCGLIFEDFNEASAGDDKLTGLMNTEMPSIQKDGGRT